MASISRGNLPSSDLREIVSNSQASLRKIASARVLICGGSGFIGTWFTSALLEANEELKLNIEIVLLTRDIEKAKKSLIPRDKDPITFLKGDLSASENPFTRVEGNFSHIIHAATPTIISNERNDQDISYKSTVLGASRLADFSSSMTSVPTLLHTSSGAVYGIQPNELKNIPEGWINEKLATGITSYGVAKLEAERILSQASYSGVLNAVNPRLFTFFGPKLPLDAKYAIGNFVSDGLSNRDIVIKGNPNTRRSYMYPTDLVEWVLECLTNPSLKPLHIGSDEGICMKDLANYVGEKLGARSVSAGNNEVMASNYVPSVTLTQNLLNVSGRVSLEDGMMRWINWLRQ